MPGLIQRINEGINGWKQIVRDEIVSPQDIIDKNQIGLLFSTTNPKVKLSYFAQRGQTIFDIINKSDLTKRRWEIIDGRKALTTMDISIQEGYSEKVLERAVYNPFENTWESEITPLPHDFSSYLNFLAQRMEMFIVICRNGTPGETNIEYEPLSYEHWLFQKRSR